MERVLKRITVMHTAIALVVALTAITALVALRAVLQHSERKSEAARHVELLEDIRDEARALGNSGRRFLLSGDGKEQQRVFAIEDDLNRRRVDLRKMWPELDASVDAYTAAVVRSFGRDRTDVLAALGEYENVLQENGSLMNAMLEEQIAVERDSTTAVHISADLAQGFLAVAAVLAFGLLVASSRIAAGAVQQQQAKHDVAQLARARIDETRRTLLASSRELHAPLERIVDDVGLLGSSPRSESDREVLESIAKNARRVEAKLRDLLDVTGLESGDLSLRKESCNVALLVNDAIKSQRKNTVGPGIRLRFDLPLGVTVLADRSRLVSIFSSLLDIQVSSANNEALVGIDTTDVGGAVEFAIATDFTVGEVGTTFREPFPLPDDLRILLADRVVAAHGGRLQLDHDASGTAIRFTIPTEMP